MIHLLLPGAQYNRVPSQWRLAGSPWLHPPARLPRDGPQGGFLESQPLQENFTRTPLSASASPARRLGLGIHFIDRKVLASDPARSQCLTSALELLRQILWGKR